MKKVTVPLLVLSVGAILLFGGCRATRGLQERLSLVDTIQSGDLKEPLSIELTFTSGEEHNHPTFAIWIEDMEGNYVQTLFVTRYLSTGIYGHGGFDQEVWKSVPGPQQRPATLPYWLHKRSDHFNIPLLPDSAHPVLDGYTGATPKGDFVFHSGVKKAVSGKIRLLLEINQAWDWNEFWTNSLYDDPDYRTSCQPSLVYAVTIDLNNPDPEYYLNPIGHGHYAGKDGKLYTDLSTFTTAMEILEKASVKLIKYGR
jgi:hypothetical protein